MRSCCVLGAGGCCDDDGRKGVLGAQSLRKYRGGTTAGAFGCVELVGLREDGVE